nr:MAG: RNA-dependent RNA polymerase [Jingmen bat reo-like virus 2]
MDDLTTTCDYDEATLLRIIEQINNSKYKGTLFNISNFNVILANRKSKLLRDVTAKKDEIIKLSSVPLQRSANISESVFKKKQAFRIEKTAHRIKKLDNIYAHAEKNLEIDMMKYINSVEYIRLINGNRYGVTTGVEELTQVSSKLLEYPRAIVLDIMKLVNWDIDKMKTIYGFIPEIPHEILNPPKFQPTWFNYSPEYNRPINPYMRYVPNIDVSSFYKTYSPAIPTIKECEHNNDLRSIRAMHILLRDYTNELRALYSHKIIIGLIEGTISNNVDYDIHPCYSLPLYIIHKLLEPYDDWPFLETGNKMQWNMNIKASSMLPTLIYVLFNLQIQLILGNVSFIACRIAIEVYLDWARVSLNQLHLDNKSNYTAPVKLLFEYVNDVTLPIYGDDGTLLNIKKGVGKCDEIWYGDEKEELLHKLSLTHPSYQTYFKQIMAKGIKDVPTLINIMTEISIIANPGNFKKTAPVLEMRKSVDPKTENPVPFPRVLEVYDDMVKLKYDFTDVPGLKQIWDEFQLIKPTMLEHVNNIDMEREFWERITNKSAGKQLDDAIKATLPDKLIPLTKQRLIQALLTRDEFNDQALFMQKVMFPGEIGKREQNDRRLRMIEVVNNLIQSLAIIPYKVAEILSESIDDLASGKQVGDIRDMVIQLVGSSDEHNIISSVDISGADAATQKPLALMIFCASLELFKNYEKKNYFWAGKRETLVYNVKSNETQMREINPIELFVSQILPLIQNVDFKLRDGVFGTLTAVSGMIFWSGLFSTAGQHNFILALCVRSLSRIWQRNNKDVRSRLQVSGDDVMQIFKYMSDDEVQEYMKALLENFTTIGFESVPELSKWSGVFLQQKAVFGRVAPLPARISVICSEKGESVSRILLEQFEELHSVFTELAARSRYAENWMPIYRGLFNASRNIQYEVNRLTEGSKAFLNNVNNNKLLRRFIRYNGLNVRIIYPYVTLFSPQGLGTPFPSIITKYGNILPASHLMPMKSDVQNIILRRLYCKDDRDVSEGEKVIIKVKVMKARRAKAKSLDIKLPNVMDEAELWVPLYWRMDHELLEEHGWTFAQYICSIDIKERLLLRREADIGERWISDLVARLENTQNQELLQISRKADERLKDLRIFIKDSLLYHKSAAERIKNSIMEMPESDAEISDASNYIIGKLMLYNGKYKQAPNEGMFSVMLKWSHEVRDLSSDYKYNKDIVLIPSFREGSEAESVLSTTCYTMTRLSGSSLVYSKFDKTKFRNIQIEDIVSEGVRIYNISPTLIETYFDAIQLPQRYLTEVRDLIIEAATFGISAYRTILQPRKYFAINTHPMAFLGSISALDVATNRRNKQIEDYRRVVARDILLSYGQYTNKKLIVIVKQETREIISGGPSAVSF